ncbi:MAG: hypothetical protein HYV07_18730 [Deltaproteobacteria bacterium]|nr:hypothetical protein [Deltaproteobacteria bacterium]
MKAYYAFRDHAVPQIAPPKTPSSSLGVFVDGLMQTFEDRRSGLDEATLSSSDEKVTAFFVGIYENERPRLRATIAELESHLTPDAQAALLDELDALLAKVVIPAYARACRTFTRHERNDFFYSGPSTHALERIALAIAGILVGLFVITVPFIPLWAKEWIIPFMIAGLLFPELRRWASIRRYEARLNDLVARADREISRLDASYLLRGESIPELSALEHRGKEESVEQRIQRSRGGQDGQGQR